MSIDFGEIHATVHTPRPRVVVHDAPEYILLCPQVLQSPSAACEVYADRVVFHSNPEVVYEIFGWNDMPAALQCRRVR